MFEPVGLVNCDSLFVLNLVINGWPSIPYYDEYLVSELTDRVLNLVINGWPSIHQKVEFLRKGDR